MTDPKNTIAFQGEPGAYSDLACRTACPEMATLPCIGIARTAGLKLREMLKAGPVRVWFRANVENGWRRVP